MWTVPSPFSSTISTTFSIVSNPISWYIPIKDTENEDKNSRSLKVIIDNETRLPKSNCVLFSYNKTSCVKPQHSWELASRSSWNTGMHSGLSNREKLWSEVTLVTVDWPDDLLPCEKKKEKKKRIKLCNKRKTVKNVQCWTLRVVDALSYN